MYHGTAMKEEIEKRKADKIQVINRTTAKYYVPSVFEPLGLECHVFAMKTVARIEVKFSEGKALHIYVGYTEMRKPGALEAIAQNVLTFKQAYDQLGHRANIKRWPSEAYIWQHDL